MTSEVLCQWIAPDCRRRVYAIRSEHAEHRSESTYAALYISYMHPVHCAALKTLLAYCSSRLPEARLLKKELVLAIGEVARTLGRQFSAVPLLLLSELVAHHSDNETHNCTIQASVM
jgi:hypothetical protein